MDYRCNICSGELIYYHEGDFNTYYCQCCLIELIGHSDYNKWRFSLRFEDEKSLKPPKLLCARLIISYNNCHYWISSYLEDNKTRIWILNKTMGGWKNYLEVDGSIPLHELYPNNITASKLEMWRKLQ